MGCPGKPLIGYMIAIVASSISLAYVSPSKATVALSLNLRYNDPADATEGGTWDLMARTDSPFGIASIKAVIDGIDLSGIVLRSGIGAVPLESRQAGTIVEFVYSQDPNGIIPHVGNVGRGAGTPGNLAKDDLFFTAANSYDNMARIASGTFGSSRPNFAVFPEPESGPTTVQEYANASLTAVTPPDSTVVLGGGDGVRGDSVAFDGLRLGDANRDGVVNNSDFGIVINRFYQGNHGWNDGDFNDDSFVSTSDYNTVINSFFLTTPSPAVVTVPESTGLQTAMIGVAILFARVRPGRALM